MHRLPGIALVLAILAVPFALSAQIWTEDFETDGEGVRYTSSNSFYGGSQDHFQRTDNGFGQVINNADGVFYSNFNGSWIWAGEDLDDNDGDGLDSKTITWSGIDITGISSLKFQGLFGANAGTIQGFLGFDQMPDDELYLEYQVDGGGYSTFLAFRPELAADGRLQEDTDLDGTPDGAFLDLAMQEFQRVLSVSGTTLDLRLYVHADNFHEEFGFDYFRLTDLGSNPGCTDNTACNYDATATGDDCSCTFVGNTCDDANPATTNDVLQADCSCSGDAAQLVITEIMYNPATALGSDANWEYLEIYNAGPSAVDLEYFSIPNFAVVFPGGSSIASGEYIIVARNAASFGTQPYQVFDGTGTLNNGSEVLQIQDPLGNVIDEVIYSTAGLWPSEANGDGPGLSLNNPADDNSAALNWHAHCTGGGDLLGSPGAANPGPLSGCTDPLALNYEACAVTDDGSCTYLSGPSDIVINELHYAPCPLQGNDSDFEFIELYNASASTYDLTDWSFSGITFTFPMGTSMAPGEYIVIGAMDSDYSYLAPVQVFTATTVNTLNDSGDTVTLFDDTGVPHDQVSYTNTTPWPTSPDEGCVSLELLDATAENNDASNWSGSLTFGGTPGAPNSVLGAYACSGCGMGAASELILNEDFESGLANWSMSNAGDWTTQSGITGNSLAHNVSGTSGFSSISRGLGCFSIGSACTTWSFDLRNAAGWTADAANSIGIWIGLDGSDLSSASGYGITFDGIVNAGNLAFVRLDAGAVTTLVAGALSLPDAQAASVEVRHTEDGTWAILLDVDGGQDTFLAFNETSSDGTYNNFSHVNVSYGYDASYAGALEVDNLSISQCGTPQTFYSVASGNSNGAVWSTDPMGTGTTAAFGPFTDVIIQTGDAVTFNDDRTMGNLQVDGTADLGAQVINIYGDLTNNGTLTTTAAALAFKGSSAATIGGSGPVTLHSTTIGKAGGASVSLTSPASLRGLMGFEGGTFDTGGFGFTLEAFEGGRGSIGTLANGADFLGDVAFQTFIPGVADDLWVNLGNPITGATLADWDDELPTTGFPGSDFPNYGDENGIFVNVYTYDESLPGDLNEFGFTAPTDISNALSTSQGYLVWLDDPAITAEVSGGIQKGSIAVPLSYSTDAGPTNDGWHLVTNPYPCDVDWTEVYNASTGMAPQYYVVNSEDFSYIFYDAVSATGTASPVIAAGQSMWVKALSGGGAINWEEEQKSAMYTAFERNSAGLPKLGLTLTMGNETDDVWLVQKSDATASLDDYDGIAFAASGFDIALESADELLLTVNYIPTSVEALSIPVHIAGPAGTYALSVSEYVEIPEGYCMVIEDLNSGEMQLLDESMSFTFEKEASDGVRFLLHVGQVLSATALSPDCYGGNGMIQVESTATGNFTWMDELGNVLDTEAGDVSLFTEATAGGYTVSVESTGWCPAASLSVWMDQPAEETLTIEGTRAHCQSSTASLHLSGSAPEMTATISDGSETWVVDFEGDLEWDELDPAVYNISVNSACKSWSEAIDLIDPDAVTVELSTPAESLVWNDAAMTAIVDAAATNAESFTWEINGTAVDGLDQWLLSINGPGIYSVGVTASNENCTATDNITIEVSSATGVLEQAEAAFELTQTAEGIQLQFEGNVGGVFDIRITDAAGRVVFQDAAGFGSGSIYRAHLQDLRSGVYAVTVLGEKSRWNEAFILR